MAGERSDTASIDMVVSQLRALGVRAGGVLVVHTSYGALRPIEDGPFGLIRALREALGPEGTLVMPAWTGDDSAPFDPATTPPATDLGVLPAMFWRLPRVVRSKHPFAFAALGPRAQEIVDVPLVLPPHGPASPIGRVHDLDGQVLLLGVGHDADTTMHLAEVVAGVLYGVPRHCLVRENGRVVRLDYRENDHCCARFVLADPWLRERRLQTEGPVAHGEARLARSRDIVRVVVEHLRADPLVFLHPLGTGCGECDEARRSLGPVG